MTTLVRNLSWQNYGMNGCCGAHIISRIMGKDTTTSLRNNALESWYRNTAYKRRIQVVHTDEARPYLARAVKMLKLSPETDFKTVGWSGGAIPTDIAFAAVLASIPRQSIVFLADNMSETGDVHYGAFTTRRFSQWFVDNDLGFRITGGPVKSRRTEQHIQGWILHPNWSRCNNIIRQAHIDLRTHIKELNSDPRLKERAQEVTHAAARERQALSNTLSNGW